MFANVTRPALPSATPAAMSAPDTLQVRFDQPRRERDFGIGYGRSSGYAQRGRYSSRSDRPLFRVV